MVARGGKARRDLGGSSACDVVPNSGGKEEVEFPLYTSPPRSATGRDEIISQMRSPKETSVLAPAHPLPKIVDLTSPMSASKVKLHTTCGGVPVTTIVVAKETPPRRSHESQDNLIGAVGGGEDPAAQETFLPAPDVPEYGRACSPVTGVESVPTSHSDF